MGPREVRNHPLLLGATHGQCITTDKIPETPANIIAAAAFLLEGADCGGICQ